MSEENSQPETESTSTTSEDANPKPKARKTPVRRTRKKTEEASASPKSADPDPSSVSREERAGGAESANDEREPASQPSRPHQAEGNEKSEASQSENPASDNRGPSGEPSSHSNRDDSRGQNDGGGSRRGRRRFRPRRRGRQEPTEVDDGDGFYPGKETDQPSNEEEAPLPEDYEPVYEEGIVEVSGKGFGFLRDKRRNFTQSNSDTFVTPEVVRRHNLRDGMWIKGQIRKGNRGPQLFKLTELEGEDPDNFQNLPVFEELTTINPLERLKLETDPSLFTTRVIDLMTPIGKGQRGLIVAPPRTGKTTLLQHIAEAVIKNHPDIKLIVLLVDERPEEVTELRRCLPTAEFLASSNDSDLKSHTRIAQLAIDRARRLVEMGKDVFVVMDSLTRVGRAFNNAQGGGGRTMSGGMDSRALEIPRKLFASARNTEEAGSLTIMATALIETGSRMDELIFLEFKGTGNMELVLDRKISDQRIYPAVDIFQSGTRREELLLPADALQKINVIRRGLAGHKPIEAIERLIFFLKKYPTNAEMLAGIPG